MFHPQLPLGMPCYDFVPVTELTVDPLFVRKRTKSDISIFKYCNIETYPLRFRAKRGPSGISGFLDVTGSEYKVRERIQRDIADSRLLAIPASWSRVADSNPNWDAL